MGLTVYGGGGKPEEEKTVTAGTSAIEVSPSSGKVMKKVTVNPTPTESKSVTPTTSELTVTPSEGKHLSKVVVGAVEDVTPEVTAQTPVITQILEGLVGKAQGANITPETVLKGFKGYRGQELVEGNYEPIGLAALFGCTKYAVDKFTLSSDQSIYNTNSYIFPHSLGEKPRFAFLYSKDALSTVNYLYYLKQATASVSGDAYWSGVYSYSSTEAGFPHSNASGATTATAITLTGGTVSYMKLQAGVEYTLITMA